MSNTLAKNALYKSKSVDYNFLANNGFKLNFTRLPTIEFYSQSSQVPGINLGEVVVEYRSNSIPFPGEKVRYDLFTMNFIVDENMQNYLELYKWIKELSVEEPEDPVAAKAAGIKNKSDTRSYMPAALQPFSRSSAVVDAAESRADLLVLNSNYNTIASFVFLDIFPLSITGLNFTTQSPDVNYVTCTADFAYTKYYVKEIGI